MTAILAIDPGITGALAFYLPDFPDRVSALDMPLVDGEVNAHALRDMIETYKPTCAVIEQVGPMPRDGVRQAWRFSAAYTTARVVVALLGIPMTLVVPGRWKKAMNVKGGPDGKEQCRAKALQLSRPAQRRLRASEMPGEVRQRYWLCIWRSNFAAFRARQLSWSRTKLD